MSTFFSVLPILTDDPVSIFNDFRPQRWNRPVSETWPGVVWVLIFTIVHYIIDQLVDSYARRYAQRSFLSSKQNSTNSNSSHPSHPSPKLLQRPIWLSDTLHAKISSISSTRALSHQMDSLLTANSTSMVKNQSKQSLQSELINYHKQLMTLSKHISKFKEATFKVCCFSFVYFYGICILFDNNLSKFFWEFNYMCNNGWPQSPGNLNNIINLNYYYWLQIGYHGHRALYQINEYQRKDFWAMFIHHWVTVLLLCGSYSAGYQQLGSLVSLCNDNVDLIMPLAKLSEYIGLKKISKCFFALFAILWIPLRIILYAYKVLGIPLTCGYYEHLRPYPVHWILVGGLCIIYGLQVYWTKFLLQMLWLKAIKGGEAVDTRSGDEDDDINIKKKD